MSITKEQIAAVKARGFLLNRGTERFSGRVVSPGGVFSAEDFASIAECARRFGSGTIALSSRQCPELVGIPYEKIEEAEAFIESRGLVFGGTGAKVRPLTSCKGTTCVYGNIDTQALAKELHERFYVGMGNVKLPHKFKIGVGGCPNSCMKPSLNDIGIEGRKPFAFDEAKCKNCKKCGVVQSCPVKAATVEDGRTVVDAGKCISCGVCVGKCPFEAVPKQAPGLCQIYVGGTWGKTQRHGTPLKRLVPPEEAGDLVEKAMLWYRENGLPKERFGVTIDRVGMDRFEEAIFSDDLLARRAEILDKPL